MKQKGHTILLIFLLGLVAACGHRKPDEEVLWEYYSGFTYSPGLFDSLKNVVSRPETKSFLMGLRCFEKYSQDKKADCYDSAHIIFEDLIKNYPSSYLGYLGSGILLTERGKFTGEIKLFDSARGFYQKAKMVSPKHPAIYYYFGRNEYNADKKVISVEAIQLLDTAILLKPDFFKANERSAEFLSHYLDMANALKSEDMSNNPAKIVTLQKFNIVFPQAENRIRYLFDRSLALDSTWQETYEGIAKAHRVYSAHDRIQYLEKAIKIAEIKNVSSIDLIKTITNLHFYELNDYNSSFKYFESWIDVYGTPADFVNRGWCYYYLGEKGEASKDFRRAMRSHSEKADFQVAQYYKLEHKYDSSLFFLNKILDTDAKASRPNPICQVEKAKMLLLMKRTPEAKNILQDVVKQGGKGDYEAVYNAKTLLESLSEKGIGHQDPDRNATLGY